MVNSTGLPRVGDESIAMDVSIKEKDGLVMDSRIDKSVFGLSNLQQGMVAEGIPSGVMAFKPINGNLIIDGTIAAEKLIIGNGAFVSDIIWSTSFYDQVEWTAGSLYFKNGTVVEINSGNTGRLGNLVTKYIYWSPETGATLQVTANQDEIVGQAVLLAIVEPQASTSRGAVITPSNTTGTTISGNNIKTGKIESTDGSTYFDLDGDRLVINDGTNDRVIIGKF
jgi:hypothetical protein